MTKLIYQAGGFENALGRLFIRGLIAGCHIKSPIMVNEKMFYPSIVNLYINQTLMVNWRTFYQQVCPENFMARDLLPILSWVGCFNPYIPVLRTAAPISLRNQWETLDFVERHLFWKARLFHIFLLNVFFYKQLHFWC